MTICPACNGKRMKQHPKVWGVTVCSRCGAVFGSCPQNKLYSIVLPFMATVEVTPEQLRYYDLMVPNGNVVRRHHGWFDPETKLAHERWIDGTKTGKLDYEEKD
jgi:hypothetical protein